MMNNPSNREIVSLLWATVLAMVIGIALARAEMPKEESTCKEKVVGRRWPSSWPTAGEGAQMAMLSVPCERA